MKQATRKANVNARVEPPKKASANGGCPIDFQEAAEWHNGPRGEEMKAV